MFVPPAGTVAAVVFVVAAAAAFTIAVAVAIATVALVVLFAVVTVIIAIPVPLVRKRTLGRQYFYCRNLDVAGGRVCKCATLHLLSAYRDKTQPDDGQYI